MSGPAVLQQHPYQARIVPSLPFGPTTDAPNAPANVTGPFDMASTAIVRRNGADLVNEPITLGVKVRPFKNDVNNKLFGYQYVFFTPDASTLFPDSRVVFNIPMIQKYLLNDAQQPAQSRQVLSTIDVVKKFMPIGAIKYEKAGTGTSTNTQREPIMPGFQQSTRMMTLLTTKNANVQNHWSEDAKSCVRVWYLVGLADRTIGEIANDVKRLPDKDKRVRMDPATDKIRPQIRPYTIMPYASAYLDFPPLRVRRKMDHNNLVRYSIPLKVGQVHQTPYSVNIANERNAMEDSDAICDNVELYLHI
jgi:hypothetical protein